MKRRALLLSLTALTAAANAAPTSFSYRTFHYACAGGQKIDVSYVATRPGGPGFALLDWRGQQYGLAQAVSASGARYASLYGPGVGGSGLEWWEHQGEATLSTFTGPDTRQTRVLLTGCRVSGKR